MKNLLYLSLLIVGLSGCIKSEKADLILRNAKIYTVDAQFSIGQAMAIRDGKILEIGRENEILNKYRYDDVFDAQTRPVFPGFIDAHCHFLGYGLSLSRLT